MFEVVGVLQQQGTGSTGAGSIAWHVVDQTAFVPLAALSGRGIQTIVSGYALPDDAIHAPNESFRLTSLDLGEKTARSLFAELSRLR